MYESIKARNFNPKTDILIIPANFDIPSEVLEETTLNVIVMPCNKVAIISCYR